MNAQVTPLRSNAETQLIEQFRANRETLPGGADAAKLREAAFAVFTGAGLPTRRNEAWHYTDLRAAMREALPWAPDPDVATIAVAKAKLGAMAEVDAVRLVLLDGIFMPQLSDLASVPAGVRVTSLARALADGRSDIVARMGALEIAKGDPAFALNAAFVRDGVVIEVDAGTRVERPLRLVSIRSGGTASAARSMVVVGKNASVFVMEVYESGSGPNQTNDALEFIVGAGAKVRHATTQRLGDAALAITTVTADLAEKSEWHSFALTTGAAVSRRQMFVRFSGEHAKARLSGVSLLNGRQHADITLVVDHAVPNGQSRERFKHIVDDEATSVFQGKIIVRPHAQKTDGGMKSNAILLSEGATMYSKPELEIFADDVVCGHGATCGDLDENHLFYCMARGIPRPEAESLLLAAFAGEIIDEIEHDGLRELLEARVSTWLDSRSAVRASATQPSR